MSDAVTVPREGDDEELERAKSDRDWWNRVGAIIGLRVSGWTYRDAATLVDDQHTLQCDAWLAQRLLSAASLPDPRLAEWGYDSLDAAMTHLGELRANQAAFDGLGVVPTQDERLPGLCARFLAEEEGAEWAALDNDRADVERWFDRGQALADRIAALPNPPASGGEG